MAFCHCCLNSNLETETNVLICLESLFLAGGTYNFGNKQTPNAPHILSSFVTVKHSNCIIIWYLFQQNIKLFMVGYVIGYVSKSKKKVWESCTLDASFLWFYRSYVECSALENRGLRHIVEEAVWILNSGIYVYFYNVPSFCLHVFSAYLTKIWNKHISTCTSVNLTSIFLFLACISASSEAAMMSIEAGKKEKKKGKKKK